jgi:hypothetical protein
VPAIGVLTLRDLCGLWRRTLLQHQGREADRTSPVFWLQGPRFFLDLRQPANLALFDGVGCLRDLRLEQCRELARQQGFAGVLSLDGDIAEWRREIDFHPDSGIADRAQLQLTGQVLTETGTEAPYIEQWERESDPADPGWGARLREAESGRTGFVARVDNRLMFARSRASPLPSGGSLGREIDAAETLEARCDLLDFEISLGRIGPGGSWLIERSTLPFKQGRRWPVHKCDSREFAIGDLDPAGRPVTRQWRIVEADGPLKDFP